MKPDDVPTAIGLLKDWQMLHDRLNCSAPFVELSNFVCREYEHVLGWNNRREMERHIRKTIDEYLTECRDRVAAKLYRLGVKIEDASND